MWRVTFRGSGGEEVPPRPHVARRRARRRVHGRHVRAHRHPRTRLRRPVRRHLRAHRRGRCGPRKSSAARASATRAGAPSAPTCCRPCAPPTAGRRRRRAGAGPGGHRRQDGDALGSKGQGAPTLGFSFVPDRELSTIHVVDGRGPQRARPRWSSTRAAPTTPGTRSATPSRSSPRPGASDYTLTGIVKFGSTNSLLGGDHRRVRPEHGDRGCSAPRVSSAPST